jgi:hypothetical protein
MKKLISILTLTIALLFTILPIANAETSVTNIEVVPKNSDKVTDPPKFGEIYFIENKGCLTYTTKNVYVANNDPVHMYANVYSDVSFIDSVILTINTPNGKQTAKLNYSDDLFNPDLKLWHYGKGFDENDIGMWSIEKIEATDQYGNTAQKTFKDLNFYVLPGNYKRFTAHPSIVDNYYNRIKITFNTPIDINTFNNTTIRILEESVNFDPLVKGNKLKFLNDFSTKLSEDKTVGYISRFGKYEKNKAYYIIISENINDSEGNKISPIFIKIPYRGVDYGEEGRLKIKLGLL